MKKLFLSLLFCSLGCSSTPATNLLCQACRDDSQCGGNPCFQDVSGNRFCGSPCGAGCPSGYACQPLGGTGGKVVMTCFPNTESCLSAPNPYGDAGVPMPKDLAGQPPPDLAGLPQGGAIGPTGGSVDRLYFGFTGDTRPAMCGTSYPQMIIDNIFTQMAQQGVQFAVDQGDHMFNCGSGNVAFADAKTQMGYYMTSTQLLGKQVFMTMGNHECSGSSSTLCSTATSYGTNPNFTAFMDALAPVSTKPYYRVDVATKSGLAAFIMVADDAWDSAQEQWLTTQLTDADAHAKYTFVSKHHPDGNTDHPEFQTIYNLVLQHKYTLFLTGHSHLFRRSYTDARALVIGCGGAPLAGGNFYGYGTALQGPDDRIYVNVYDQATGNVMEHFDVGPQ
jgi:hypothetical protein